MIAGQLNAYRNQRILIAGQLNAYSNQRIFAQFTRELYNKHVGMACVLSTLGFVTIYSKQKTKEVKIE